MGWGGLWREWGNKAPNSVFGISSEHELEAQRQQSAMTRINIEQRSKPNKDLSLWNVASISTLFLAQSA